MVFSKDKWSDSDELNQFIPVSAALSFEKVESSLNDAWQLFIVPLLGEELAAEVVLFYQAEEPTELQKKVLLLCQRAVANLAFWYNYTELNIRISDQGMQRQESDGSFKQMYKYQEDQLRMSFKNKGFNALDQLVEVFDKHQTDFPSYIDSPAYTSRQMAIVRSTAEVDDIHFINGSHLIFLRLKPVFKMIEETQLQPVLGSSLYDALLKALERGETSLGDTTVEELRRKVAAWVVFKSMAELVRNTGSLTDRGLYFAQVHEGDGNLSLSPADKEQAAARAANFENCAEKYHDRLMNFIRNRLPEFYKGSQSDVLNRDNDNKRSVWL